MTDQNRPDRDETEPTLHDTDEATEPLHETPAVEAVQSTEPIAAEGSPDSDADPVEAPITQVDPDRDTAQVTAPADETERAEDADRVDDVTAGSTVDSSETVAQTDVPSEPETTTWVPSDSDASVAAAGTGAVGAAVAANGEPAADRFTWHPEYAGRSVDEVREELAMEIAADQRQYSVVMEGAEEAEQDALSSIVSLERKWGQYDFGWAELDANDLASRIVAFEQERERRRELISWADYRQEPGAAGMTDSGELPPAELSTSLKAISLGLVVLLIVVILLAVWAL